MSEPILSNPRAAKYGGTFWHVRLRGGDVVGIHAKAAEVLPDGTLRFAPAPQKDGTPRPVIETATAFAAREWCCYYSASVIDGTPVMVEWWTEPDSSPPLPPPAERGA